VYVGVCMYVPTYTLLTILGRISEIRIDRKRALRTSGAVLPSRSRGPGSAAIPTAATASASVCVWHWVKTGLGSLGIEAERLIRSNLHVP